jgi:hypothetical protein
MEMRMIRCSRLALLCLAVAVQCRASDHLDSPTVIADPRTDIGDVYAWMSPDHQRLNLVMTIVGHSFSDRVAYVFHVDSGRKFGSTTSSTDIVCRFAPAGDSLATRSVAAATETDCIVGKEADHAHGDASVARGLQSRHRRFRVFAGLRDDPFFNNVRGTRAAYAVASKALQGRQPEGCPHFDAATSAAILDQWRHTDGGPATNLLAGWTPAAIVVTIDVDLVNRGGRVLAFWGATVGPDRQIDRAGRPLTGNALLNLLGAEQVTDVMKEEYNSATPSAGWKFIPEIEKGVAIYDSFDGRCGNSLLGYHAMATLLADDRLWINSSSGICTQLFAVELADLTGRKDLQHDCGGRTPNYDSVNIYRSLLVDGTNTSIDDGLHRDERIHSTTEFPFLASPDPVGTGR